MTHQRPAVLPHLTTTDPNLNLSLDLSLDLTLDLYLDLNLNLDLNVDLNLNPTGVAVAGVEMIQLA